MSKLEIPERIKSLVFEPKEIGGMTVKNRLVRSATVEGMSSENGSVTHELLKLYKTLAEGGIGLIITGVLMCNQVVRFCLTRRGQTETI